jgi:hypothetical protein
MSTTTEKQKIVDALTSGEYMHAAEVRIFSNHYLLKLLSSRSLFQIYSTMIDAAKPENHEELAALFASRVSPG